MKKKKIYIIIILLISIFPIYSLLDLFIEASKRGFAKEPNDFRLLFKEGGSFNIKHIITVTYDDEQPFTGYDIDFDKKKKR